MARDRVFISYSHRDQEWLERLLAVLTPLVRENEIESWSDQSFSVGQPWISDLQHALNRARVVVLLVSPDYFATDYVATVSMPEIARAVRAGNLTIFWIPIAASRWAETDLKFYEAALNPTRPLEGLSTAEADRALASIAGKIRDALRRPAIFMGRLPPASALFVDREDELARLDQAWENSTDHIITIVALGGQGKTNLVRHWLDRMAADGWRGAEGVFAWSFYEDRSVAEFFTEALRFFGEIETESIVTTSPFAQGKQLAQAVGARRNLLILDGLEPLLDTPGPTQGRIADPALQTLLSGLRARNRGLCVITTRMPLPELAGVAQMNLASLTPEEGAELLGRLGVRGTLAERRDVARRLEGHPLSIHLLGTYIVQAFGGDVTRAGEAVSLAERTSIGDRAQTILQSFQRWRSGRETGAHTLAVLRLFGLFDQPAGEELIEILGRMPPIDSVASELIAALERKNRDAVRLAALASVAAQVEPELLRRLRIRLLTNSDAGAEADLWLSDLVDSKSPNALVLRDDVKRVLQKNLAASASDFDGAVAIVEELHAGLSEVVRIQEKVTALSLRGDRAAGQDIETLLQPIVRTLYEQNHAGLARWAARAFAQLPSSAQTMPTPWSMMRAASIRLQGSSPNATGARGWQAVERAIRDLPSQEIFIRVHRRGAIFGTTPDPRAARIEVPATEPLLFDVEWGRERQRELRHLAFMKGETRELTLEPRALVVRTILGDAFEVHTPAQLDDWAVVLDIGETVYSLLHGFREWVLDMAGGAVPDDQCLFGRASIDTARVRLSQLMRELFEQVRQRNIQRRLYLCVNGGSIPDDDMASVLRDGGGSFEQILLFTTASPSPGPLFQRLPPLQPAAANAFYEFKAPPSWSFALLVEGLWGQAAERNGTVTTESLSGFVTEPSNEPWQPEWHITGKHVPISTPTDLVALVEFRTPTFPRVNARILDNSGKVIAELTLQKALRRRLLRGSYWIDVDHALRRQFDTGDEPVPIVVVTREQREEWIAVTGTAARISGVETSVAKALGRRLAGSGYRLMAGSAPGVEDLCSQTYVDTLNSFNIRDSALRGFALQEGIPEETHALIVIGGESSHQRAAIEAAKNGIPHIPIANTGGAAANLYRELVVGGSSGELYELAASRAGAPELPVALLDAEWLQRDIMTDDDADDVAWRVVDLLMTHIRRRRGSRGRG